MVDINSYDNTTSSPNTGLLNTSIYECFRISHCTQPIYSRQSTRGRLEQMVKVDRSNDNGKGRIDAVQQVFPIQYVLQYHDFTTSEIKEKYDAPQLPKDIWRAAAPLSCVFQASVGKKPRRRGAGICMEQEFPIRYSPLLLHMTAVIGKKYYCNTTYFENIFMLLLV